MPVVIVGERGGMLAVLDFACGKRNLQVGQFGVRAIADQEGASYELSDSALHYDSVESVFGSEACSQAQTRCKCYNCSDFRSR